MGDEEEGAAAEAAAAHGVQSVGLHRDGLAVRPGPLTHDALIVGCTGGLELERHPAALIVEPVEGSLVVGGVDLLLPEILGPAGWNEEEDVMRHRPKLHRQVLNG